MRKLLSYFPGHAPLLFAALLGLVLGTALQLQQGQLFTWYAYMAIVLLAPVFYGLIAIKGIAIGWQWSIAAVVLGMLGFGATGLRATVYLYSALPPALEGADVRVTGVVARLPQRNETGLRFRLDVESALLDGQSVPAPPQVDVGWYADADKSAGDGSRALLPELRAGERWQMTLRLKAPHGARNPHGFDYELYLWEQGVQATGYVRTSAKDLAPQRMGQTWLYPVALARQVVRERIYRQVEERAFAGIIAALVVGDQSAIDRVDWDVFRATGVAHLVSISGLHISMFAWGMALEVGWL